MSFSLGVSFSHSILLSVSVSKCPFSYQNCKYWISDHSNPAKSHLYIITSKKTFSPNKVTSWRCGWTWILEGHYSTQYIPHLPSCKNWFSYTEFQSKASACPHARSPQARILFTLVVFSQWLEVLVCGSPCPDTARRPARCSHSPDQTLLPQAARAETCILWWKVEKRETIPSGSHKFVSEHPGRHNELYNQSKLCSILFWIPNRTGTRCLR